MSSWIAEAVGKMHINRIHQKEVAAKLGFSEEYLSMILHGKKNPKNAEVRIMTAIDELIAAKA